MKPVKFKRHMTTKHAEIKQKPIEFFEIKLKILGQQIVLIEQHITATDNIM
jgi:hypothetical protein